MSEQVGFKDSMWEQRLVDVLEWPNGGPPYMERIDFTDLLMKPKANLRVMLVV